MPEVPALEDHAPEYPVPEVPALEDHAPEEPEPESSQQFPTISSIIEDLQDLIDNLHLEVDYQDSQTYLSPIEDDQDPPVPMEIDNPHSECCSPPRKRMKTFHPIH